MTRYLSLLGIENSKVGSPFRSPGTDISVQNVFPLHFSIPNMIPKAGISFHATIFYLQVHPFICETDLSKDLSLIPI